jgi:hypothetical protein
MGMPRREFELGRKAFAGCGLLAGAALASVTLAPPALALEALPNEAKALADCDRRLCTMLLQKQTKGEDLKCNLAKTWARKTIKGADTKTLQWGFGDARCSVRVEISRALLVAAVTQQNYKLWVPAHTASCVVEQDGTLQTITATLAPKIVFKAGKAEKIWINLVRMDGSSAITGLLWAAAKLEDSTGLFQQPMIKSVNKYIYDQCPSKYPEAVPGPRPSKAAGR